MSPVITMPVGDSICMGANNFLGGWRRTLNNLAPNLMMVGSQQTVETFGYLRGQCEGYSGAYVDQLRDTVLPKVATYSPTLVLLSAGTNDVTLEVEDAENLLLLAEEFLAKPSVTQVIVGDIPPRTGDLSAATTAYNESLPAAFEEASAGISLHEIGSRLDPSGLSGDGIHPSEAGYLLLASYWFDALVAAGVTTARPVPRGGTCGGFW